MVEEVQMTYDDAVEYVRNSIEIGDILEVSYNRIFAPGEVLGILQEDPETGEGLRISMQLNGEILNQTIEIDLKDFKEDLIELHHITDEKELIIEVL